MRGKHALRIDQRLTVAAAGLATVRTDPVPPGTEWMCERIVFEGSSATSGGNTRARVYVGGHGPKYYLFEQDAPTADTLYWEDDHNRLYPGEWLALEWDQAQVSAQLILQVTGYYELEGE